jgi:hypothetical protein
MHTTNFTWLWSFLFSFLYLFWHGAYLFGLVALGLAVIHPLLGGAVSVLFAYMFWQNQPYEYSTPVFGRTIVVCMALLFLVVLVAGQ